MKLIKQSFSLPIKNHDVQVTPFQRHGCLFPGESKRGLVVGPSGCGKTNVIISLIEEPHGLRFANVYIYSKTLNQPKYCYLRHLLQPLKDIGYFESQNDEILPPTDVEPDSIIIFDDFASSDQTRVREYFSFGRHKSIDCFYLCQTYSSIPKQLIRDNANLLVVFQQDNTNLKHIYDDHVNVDMTFQQFKDLCSLCWKNKYDFLVIDKDSSLSNGRYRKGFDQFISL